FGKPTAEDREAASHAAEELAAAAEDEPGRPAFDQHEPEPAFDAPEPESSAVDAPEPGLPTPADSEPEPAALAAPDPPAKHARSRRVPGGPRLQRRARAQQRVPGGREPRRRVRGQPKPSSVDSSADGAAEPRALVDVSATPVELTGRAELMAILR